MCDRGRVGVRVGGGEVEGLKPRLAPRHRELGSLEPDRAVGDPGSRGGRGTRAGPHGPRRSRTPARRPRRDRRAGSARCPPPRGPDRSGWSRRRRPAAAPAACAACRVMDEDLGDEHPRLVAHERLALQGRIAARAVRQGAARHEIQPRREGPPDDPGAQPRRGLTVIGAEPPVLVHHQTCPALHGGDQRLRLRERRARASGRESAARDRPPGGRARHARRGAPRCRRRRGRPPPATPGRPRRCAGSGTLGPASRAASGGRVGDRHDLGAAPQGGPAREMVLGDPAGPDQADPPDGAQWTAPALLGPPPGRGAAGMAAVVACRTEKRPRTGRTGRRLRPPRRACRAAAGPCIRCRLPSPRRGASRRRGLDGEDPPPDPAGRCAPGRFGRQVQILRPDAEHHLAAGEGGERGRRPARQRSLDRGRADPVPAVSGTVNRFIGGEPRKRATKVSAGFQ